MQAEQQPGDPLQALRQAIRDDDDARIVRLWEATDLDRSAALTPQEQVRVDLAMRRVNNRRAIAAIVPYAIGGLFLVVAVVVSAIVIVPRLLARPTATPGVPGALGAPTAIAQATATATHTPALAGAQGRAISQKRTSTPTPPPTSTIAPTPTGTATSAATSTPVPTSTSTPTPTGTPTHTLTPQPSPTSTHTPLPAQTPAPTHTPLPTSALRPAPRLEAPPNGTEFGGWNAEVVLSWSGVGPLSADEYYVVRIPYDDAGGVAEFWRKETSFKVPPHFSGREVGFPDRHYNWTVQVMRCIENCASATDDNARKTGRATSGLSAEGLFYWHPDIGGPSGPAPTPTRA